VDTPFEDYKHWELWMNLPVANNDRQIDLELKGVTPLLYLPSLNIVTKMV